MKTKSPIVGPQGQTIYKEPRKRIFECILNVGAELPGGITDWPKNLQDAIYKAIERCEEDNKATLTIIESFCDHDIDQGWFVRVICIAPLKDK